MTTVVSAFIWSVEHEIDFMRATTPLKIVLIESRLKNLIQIPEEKMIISLNRLYYFMNN